MTKRLATLLVSIFVLACAGLAYGGNSGNTSAVAINKKDDATVFKVAFGIKRELGSVVDDQNAAVAYGSCNACTTAAISIQVVLIEGNASTITPANKSLAINYVCDSCVTFADARQIVLTTGGVVHFTAAGNQEIADVRSELRQLRKSGMVEPDQLKAQVDSIVAELNDALQNDLVPAGKPKHTPKNSEATHTTTAPTTQGATSTPPPDTSSDTLSG